MKHYSIGEVIHAFRDRETIAYCYRGETEGMMLRVDSDNDRLAWVTTDGEFGYDLYITMTDLPEEEGRHWVLFHELDNDIQEELELKVKIAKVMGEMYIARLDKAQYYSDLEKEGKHPYSVKLNLLADCDLNTLGSKFDEFIKSNGWEKEVYKP